MNFLNLLFPFHKPFFSFAGEGGEGAPAPIISEPQKTETPPASTPAETPSPSSTPPNLDGKSAEEIKKMISGGEGTKAPETKPAGTPESPAPATPAPADGEWFDKERGFKTKDDAIKSYQNLQESLRQRAEREKDLQRQIDELKTKSTQTPLTQEEIQKQQALERWKSENKQALDYLKDEIKKDMQGETLVNDIKAKVLQERAKWKEEFDKDDARKQLWPKMEELWASHGSIDALQVEVVKNPFPFLEAIAFYKNFPTIAEKIKTEAVEQYKAKIREANEAERAGKTALPGGARTPQEGLDVSKMSSQELGALLPRAD